jgi:hypothetical protein
VEISVSAELAEEEEDDDTSELVRRRPTILREVNTAHI